MAGGGGGAGGGGEWRRGAGINTHSDRAFSTSNKIHILNKHCLKRSSEASSSTSSSSNSPSSCKILSSVAVKRRLADHVTTGGVPFQPQLLHGIRESNPFTLTNVIWKEFFPLDLCFVFASQFLQNSAFDYSDRHDCLLRFPRIFIRIATIELDSFIGYSFRNGSATKLPLPHSDQFRNLHSISDLLPQAHTSSQISI